MCAVNTHCFCFKMPGLCPTYKKSVYAAEERKALDQSWHKACFFCSACRKMLDSTNVSGHDGKIYCATCYRNGRPETMHRVWKDFSSFR